MTWRWYFALGYLWALPGTLVGLLLAIIYRPRDWRWSEGCIEAIVPNDRMFGSPGAQTHGWLIYYRDKRMRRRRSLRVHERVHVVQGFVGGVFFMLAYVLHFLWLFAGDGFAGWKSAYYRIWAERQAYAIEDEYSAGQRPDAWGGNP